MDSIKITSGDEMEESLWEIEDILMGVERGGKGNGGEKSGKRGKKTLKAIAENNKESAEKQRKEEAINSLKKDLEHFPFKRFSEEQLPEVVDKYAEWVLKSLKEKFPYFANLDDEIDYKQTRSSGPGGQNVNKTSTAVIAKHLLTGIYARSESREMVENRKDATTKLIGRLEDHIRNWWIFLKGVSAEKREDEIRLFIESLSD